MLWRPILCLWGMILFGLLTYGSIQTNRYLRTQHVHGRYFWWGSLRLDSDPLNKRPNLKPCTQETDENCGFDPQYIFVDPGWIQKALTLSAFPAFVLALAIVRGLAHFGFSEVPIFLIATPFLILGWFYMIGWFLDRWRYKRSLRRPSLKSSLP